MDKLKKLLKNKNIKIIIGILIILIIAILLLLLFPKAHDNDVAVKDNGIYSHTEKGIIKEEEYKGVKFSNISMLTENGYTTFTADVTNVSKADIKRVYDRLNVTFETWEGESDCYKYIPETLEYLEKNVEEKN